MCGPSALAGHSSAARFPVQIATVTDTALMLAAGFLILVDARYLLGGCRGNRACGMESQRQLGLCSGRSLWDGLSSKDFTRLER